MNNTYKLDIVRYKKLLNKESILNQQDKSLVSENLNEYMELFSFNVTIKTQVSYDNRNSYDLLITNYLNKKLKLNEFIVDFLEMQKEDSVSSKIIMRDFKQLDNYLIDVNAKLFNTLLNQIEKASRLIWEYGIEKGMSESRFYNLVEDIHVQSQPFLKK